MTTEFVPRCDCCGHDGSVNTLTVFTSSIDPMRITCSFCQGLMDAGLIREEWHNGVRRFRRWSFEWVKGDLLPKLPPPTKIERK